MKIIKKTMKVLGEGLLSRRLIGVGLLLLSFLGGSFAPATDYGPLHQGTWGELGVTAGDCKNWFEMGYDYSKGQKCLLWNETTGIGSEESSKAFGDFLKSMEGIMKIEYDPKKFALIIGHASNAAAQDLEKLIPSDDWTLISPTDDYQKICYYRSAMLGFYCGAMANVVDLMDLPGGTLSFGSGGGAQPGDVDLSELADGLEFLSLQIEAVNKNVDVVHGNVTTWGASTCGEVTKASWIGMGTGAVCALVGAGLSIYGIYKLMKKD
jgi:hypothetical protein